MSLTTPLVRLRILPALLPVDGAPADIRISPDEAFIQKRVGLGDWQNLIAISELQGPIGPGTELRSNGTYVQWRSEGSDDTAWRDLFALSEIGGGCSGGGGVSDTPAQILAKLQTVDGPGSGLDADMLDGREEAFFQNASNLNAGTVSATRLPTASASACGISTISDTAGTSGAANGVSASPIAVKAVSDALALKADKATTLAGYGIGDAYTKQQTNDAIQAAVDAGGSGGSGTDTPSQILDKLKTVDGSSSGLDADLLDGQHASAFQGLAEKGVANGYASLGPDSIVPLTQLPTIPVVPATYYISNFGVPANDASGDHTAAFAALDTALAASGGGTVYIDRVCRLPSGWVLKTGNVRIVGIRGGKLTSPAGTGIITLRFRDIQNVRISDLQFEKPSGLTRETDNMTLYVLNCSNIIVEGCATLNGLAGMWFDKCSYVWTSKNRIVTPVADGIHFAVGSSDCFAIGNWVYGCGDDGLACTQDYAAEHGKRISFIGNTVEYTTWGAGVAIWETDQCLVIGNAISNTACAGIYVSYFDADGYTSSRSVDNVIEGNTILNCALAQHYLGSTTQLPEMQQACGIYLGKAGRTVVKGNVIRKITASTAAVGSVGIGVDECGSTYIQDNTIQDVQGAGVLARGEVAEIHIGNNELYNVRGVAFDLKTQNPALGDRIMIYGNNCVLCSGAVGDYIRVGANIVSRGAQTRVVGNRALDSGSSTGIVVDANANNPSVIDDNWPSSGSGSLPETSGTFSPSLQGSNGTAVSGYSASGTWRKVGPLVFFQVQYSISSVGGASGGLQVSNMPFPRDQPLVASGTTSTTSNGTGGLVGLGGTAQPSVMTINRTDNVNGGSAIQVTTSATITGVYSAA